LEGKGREHPVIQEVDTVLLAMLNSRERALASRSPLSQPGHEAASVLRLIEHRQALKELRAEEKRAKEPSRVDRAERRWLGRRFGLARR
jgi:hypothetical protein